MVTAKGPHWSYSSLSGYNMCSLQWSFRYAERLEPEHTTASLVFGTAFHAAAGHMAMLRMEGRPADTGAAKDAFAEAWLTGCKSAEEILYGEGEDFRSLAIKGIGMVGCLADGWDPDERVLAVSVPFSVELEGCMAPLVGEIDCVVGPPQNPVVIDWKTGANRWPASKADSSLQATCYCHAFHHGHGRIPQFRFDVVTKAKDPTYNSYPTTRDIDSFARLARIAQAVEKATGAGAFVPREDSYACPDCAYAGACRAWHRKAAGTISAAA